MGKFPTKIVLAETRYRRLPAERHSLVEQEQEQEQQHS